MDKELWMCKPCLLLNTGNCCIVCSSKKPVTSCPACTYVNEIGTCLCAVCGSHLGQLAVVSLESSSSSEDDNELFSEAEKRFDEFGLKMDDGFFRCKRDGKTLRTRALMKAHIVTAHKDALAIVGDLVYEKCSVSLSASKVNEDYQLALQLAMEDYEEMEITNETAALSSSSSCEKRKCRTQDRSVLECSKISESTDDCDQLRKLRIKKLLNRADSFSKKINKYLSSMLSKGVPLPYSGSEAGDRSCLQVIGDVLKDYQKDGVNWLLSLHRSRLNGLLADEMGLGKTIQVLSFFVHLKELFGWIGPHVVICPLSVLGAWREEVNRHFSSQIDLYVHHGDANDRTVQFETWKRRLRRKLEAKKVVCVVITTYEMIVRDEDCWARRGRRLDWDWQYLVVDEAQRIKNRNNVLSNRLTRLFHGPRLLLTGTPLQNNLGELWSLLSFLSPDLFDDEQIFANWFNRPFEIDSPSDEGSSASDGEISRDILRRKKKKSPKKRRLTANDREMELSRELTPEEHSLIIDSLHRLLKPFILRRLKSDVLKELPAKVEKIVECPMSALQKECFKLLKVMVKRNLSGQPSAFDEASSPTLRMNTSNVIMQLRKLCNHPFLALEDIQTIPDDIYFRYLISASGKMTMLSNLLPELLKDGHKVLIFSQMTTVLTILEGFLQLMNCPYSRLDGNTCSEERVKRISAFNDFTNTPDSAMVFLLSTRAGGVGVNLQAADTVILFDSDWNPQMDIQAISRAHRIGQSRTVLVLRFVSLGASPELQSVDQRILRRADIKLENERVVLRNGAFSFAGESVNTIAETSPESNPTAMIDLTEVTTLNPCDTSHDDDVEIYFKECSKTGSASGEDSYCNWYNSANFQSLLQREPMNSNIIQKRNSCDDNFHAIERIPMTSSGFQSDFSSVWSPWFHTQETAIPKSESDIVKKRPGEQEISSRALHDVFEGCCDDDNSYLEVRVKSHRRKKSKPSSRQSHLMKPEDGAGDISDDEMTFCVLCGVTEHQDVDEFSGATGQIDLVMLLCDGCNGGFHLGCLGIHSIPGGDWFCQWCSLKANIA